MRRRLSYHQQISRKLDQQNWIGGSRSKCASEPSGRRLLAWGRRRLGFFRRRPMGVVSSAGRLATRKVFGTVTVDDLVRQLGPPIRPANSARQLGPPIQLDNSGHAAAIDFAQHAQHNHPLAAVSREPTFGSPMPRSPAYPLAIVGGLPNTTVVHHSLRRKDFPYGR